MKRIIIIGNGFDRAHNLRTGYKEFIDDYWSDFITNTTALVSQTRHPYYIIKPFKDKYVSLDVIKINPNSMLDPIFAPNKPKSYKELTKLIIVYNDSYSQYRINLNFENDFFKQISEQCSLKNWLDIENEYYDELKKILTDEDTSNRNERVKALNKGLKAVEELLKEHLIKVTKKENIEKHQSIQEAFSSPVELDDIATCKQREFIDSVIFEIDLAGHHRYI